MEDWKIKMVFFGGKSSFGPQAISIELCLSESRTRSRTCHLCYLETALSPLVPEEVTLSHCNPVSSVGLVDSPHLCATAGKVAIL